MAQSYPINPCQVHIRRHSCRWAVYIYIYPREEVITETSNSSDDWRLWQLVVLSLMMSLDCFIFIYIYNTPQRTLIPIMPWYHARGWLYTCDGPFLWGLPRRAIYDNRPIWTFGYCVCCVYIGNHFVQQNGHVQMRQQLDPWRKGGKKGCNT